MASKGEINKLEIQPEINKKWKYISFKDSISKNGTYDKLKTKEFLNEGIFPVIDQGEKLISGYINDSEKIYKGKLPVLIFGDHTRKVKYVDFLFAVGADGTKIISPIKEYNSKFYFYYLKSLIIPSFGYSRHYSVLSNLDFPLPSIAEQERIVAKLDTLFTHLETAKAGLEKIPVLLKQFRQAVLTQAVTGKLTEEWRAGKELEDAEKWREEIILQITKLNPSKKPIEIKKVNGSIKLPKSWTFANLQDFGEFTRGKSKHRPRNDKKLFGGIYPFIQTGEVSKSNGIITEYNNTYSDFGLKQSRLFPKGTLCITIAANIAETGILDFDACFPDSVVGYIPYNNHYTAKFAMYCLMTMQQDLEHYAPSTAQKNINLGILFEIPFPVPSKEEQTEIVRRVEGLFAKADAIEEKYKQLKEKIENLPQAILAKAFRGEI
jgi:type I restriction enzyme S subunit